MSVTLLRGIPKLAKKGWKKVKTDLPFVGHPKEWLQLDCQ